MSLIRHLLVIAVLLGASVATVAAAQGSSLARSDRASTISNVPAEVLVIACMGSTCLLSIRKKFH